MRKRAATIGKMQHLQNQETNKKNGVHQSKRKMNKKSIVLEAPVFAVGLPLGGIVSASCFIPEGTGRDGEKKGRMLKSNG